MEYPECLLLLIPTVFFIIGIPLWVIGENSTSNKVSSLFTLLPLIPNGPFPYQYYNISQFEASEYTNITIPISHKNVGNKDIYLLHNGWGFDIHAELFTDKKPINQISTSQNIDSSLPYEPLTRRPIYELPKIESSLQNIDLSHNIFNVFCPYSSNTEQLKQIQPFCQSPSGYPAQVNGNYSLNKLFPSMKRYSFDSITIKFKNSFFVPYDFIEDPELYILFFRNSENKPMLIAGIVMSSIGIFSTILFVFFFLVIACC